MWGRSRRIFFWLAVMTISSARFRHDVVFLQEHLTPLSSRNVETHVAAYALRPAGAAAEPSIVRQRQASDLAGVLSMTMLAMMIHQMTRTGAVAVVPHPTAL